MVENSRDRDDEFCFVPEWAEQDAVILTWPTEWMDWRDNLGDAVACYREIVRVLAKYVPVVIVCESEELVLRELSGVDVSRVFTLSGFRQNDTWMRDYGPLSYRYGEEKLVLDFGFNGWGLKYPADRDNLFCQTLYDDTPFLDEYVFYCEERDYILEGGAVESNGAGVILTTECVVNEANRNPGRDDMEQLRELRGRLRSNRVYALDIDPMEGDDTDGHIDTLARFVDEHTILYNYTEDRDDVHYMRLQRLRAELEKLQEVEKTITTLVPLPIPSPIYNKEGNQLPATYANFLITNGAVIVPVYGDPMDEVALEIIAEHCPGRVVEGVDCRALIEQGGSLHCITMQVPKGFVNEEILG